MKARELRIGNFIYKESEYEFENGINQIISVLEFECVSTRPLNCHVKHHNVNISNLKPIPLTEEWLLKFGFDKVGIALTSIAIAPLNLPCTFNLPNTPFSFCQGKLILTTGTGDFCVNIEYVHQLQNLYFGLTGKELTLKP
jgi:hypothetical protein